MNIAIIGGGWVGCHLAYKLKTNHNVSIFEKNGTLFTETSYNNQNRLHLGFHYARNHKTRKLCLDTFDKFMLDYGNLTETVDNNLYCVPAHSSILDFETYLQIFNGFFYEEVISPIREIPNCVKTQERYINFKKVKNFFEVELKSITLNNHIKIEDLDLLQKNFDLVVNCTNNQLQINNCIDCYYELTVSMIYEKINPIGFGALTLVDGPLFSIYPYHNNQYTITDVEHTPIKRFNKIEDINNFVDCEITENFINDKKIKIENKINKFYPEFSKNFKYHSYFLSTKSKINDLSDDRYPIITQKENIINCFTGKIQGIYIIEDYINNLLK
jgi:hypothetical protein